MARVEIALPERFTFATDLTIRVSDLNYGGHLGNDRVLTLAQEVRVRWLAAHGLSELDVGGGVGIILADAAVLFRSEGRLGQRLRCELGATEVRTRSLELVIRLADAASGAEVALVKTGVLCFDYRTRKVTSLPEPLKAALAPVSGGSADGP